MQHCLSDARTVIVIPFRDSEALPPFYHWTPYREGRGNLIKPNKPNKPNKLNELNKLPVLLSLRAKRGNLIVPG